MLVDADGEPSRKRVLESALHAVPGARIIAVAIHEFESWLVSDGGALNLVLTASASSAPNHPEKLAPAAAKALLKTLTEGVNAREARLNLARHLDLKVLAAPSLRVSRSSRP